MKKGKVYGGVLLICGEKFLLGQRGKDGSLEGIKRELYEETEIESDNIRYIPFEEQWDMGYPYHLYLGYCNEEYECKLNEENQDWGWFDLNDLPKPLFPTLFASLTRIF
jgi:8-oxo-dGTP pyrophosphatase MutT (NUDIX family)